MRRSACPNDSAANFGVMSLLPTGRLPTDQRRRPREPEAERIVPRALALYLARHESPKDGFAIGRLEA